MAQKKLTDKQVDKVVGIVTCDYAAISESVKAAVRNPTDAKALKAAKKILASSIKAIDKAIAIVCPPPKVKE